MVLYRISNCLHAKDFSGTGAKLYGGRWNSVGIPLHYMASNRALAALEVLVNKNSMINSKNFCLTVFELPEKSIKTLEIEDLPEDWKSYPAPNRLAKMGDAFVNENKYLLLKVPSAIIIDEYNYMMNVNHSLADKIKIIEVKPFNFDNRLL
ncbi:RES family NAD+ phosphorylase [Pedobacter jejuensis]|uniref:RES domain-containing protein n=1 Tax=Pedobacter jejuensis TaxID=1268550 RepID=A0A3N0BYA0_9SPHI|nr:RES family NAD+ phosphorylase [Pedobacter jejuensis]RNL54242.1 RES domain-containing protein [Pedobacter jejuensis]